MNICKCRYLPVSRFICHPDRMKLNFHFLKAQSYGLWRIFQGINDIYVRLFTFFRTYCVNNKNPELSEKLMRFRERVLRLKNLAASVLYVIHSIEPRHTFTHGKSLRISAQNLIEIHSILKPHFD